MACASFGFLAGEFLQFFKCHKWSFIKYIVSFFWFENVNGFLQVRHGTRGKGGGLPCPFLKIKKSALILEKICPDCVYPCVKFAIQNVILRVSKRKNSKNFPCRAFFLDFLIKCLSSALISRNLPCPEKFLVPHLQVKLSLANYHFLHK